VELESLSSDPEIPLITTPPICSAISELETIPEDVLRYIELCETGKIYRHLETTLTHRSTTYGGFKRRILSRILYCKNHDNDNDLSTQFATLFPSVSDFIRYLKKNDYRHLPQQLQRVEAGLVIHGVCGRLMNEYPTVPVLTIHDSIMTTPANEPLIRKLLTEEALALGCDISTKTK